MTEVKEKANKDVCPPHNWKVSENEKEKGTDPDKAIADKKKESQGYAEAEQKRMEQAAKSGNVAKPKYAHPARSLAFEAKAIEENQKKKKIKATEITYKCSLCPENFSVDIEFEDGQVAEAQSKGAETYRKEDEKGIQAAKLCDLQRQKNAEKGTNHQPMAKFDKDQIGDETAAAEVAAKRGFQVPPEFL